MKRKQLIIISLILVILKIAFGEDIQITEYKLIYIPFKTKNGRYLAIRSFYLNNTKKVLAVNVDTLQTQIFNWEITNSQKFDISDSRYFKLLNKSVSEKLHNGGIKNGNTNLIYLSVDLCPSSKKEPFEKEAIQNFINKGYKDIAFAISGKWFIKNKKYIDWIKQREKNNELNVIWINHTYNHFYGKDLPLEKNFLLKEGTDITFEITEVEKLLIKNGITPSIFIRFPGLVANYELRKEIAYKYSLIAIGTDTWLANNQKIKQGSIILIHGNKNEPKGIQIFEKLLQQQPLNFGSLLTIQP